MQTSTRILRRPQVEDKVGLRRSALYDKINPKSASFDPSFPKPVHLGSTPTSPVGWVEAELDAWLASRIAMRASRPAS